VGGGLCVAGFLLQFFHRHSKSPSSEIGRTGGKGTEGEGEEEGGGIREMTRTGFNYANACLCTLVS